MIKQLISWNASTELVLRVVLMTDELLNHIFLSSEVTAPDA